MYADVSICFSRDWSGAHIRRACAVRGVFAALAAVLLVLPSGARSATECPAQKPLALQVLGSGGPVADDGRASAGYVIWIDGKSRVLIDAGGGSFLRFGESAAKFADLDFIGISHFHTDHSADLPALLKSGYFTDRKRDLHMAGPAGGGPFPGLQRYLERLLGAESGAYAYLSGYLDGSGGLPRIDGTEVRDDPANPVRRLSDGQSALQIDAMHVPHGIVPALAFRVRIGGATLVFAGDQNGSDRKFVEFARGANVLVMHMPIPPGADRVARRLHAPPAEIARIARDAGAETLVLSHFMARSLRDLEKNVGIVRSGYDGKLVVADDLDCFAVN